MLKTKLNLKVVQVEKSNSDIKEILHCLVVYTVSPDLFIQQ